jgi:hypothetical protein
MNIQGVKRLREKTYEFEYEPALKLVIPYTSSAELLKISQISQMFNPLVELEFSHRVGKVSEKIFSINKSSLKNEQIIKICQFTEKWFDIAIRNHNFHLFSENTGLPCDLEFDPETRLCFIHTTDLIGGGAIKDVSLSILYDPNNPKMVVSSVENDEYRGYKIDEEIRIHKLVAHISRVIPLIATPPPFYSSRKHAWIQRFITKFCPLGTLGNFDKSLLSMKDRVSMAKDLLEGLKDMYTLKERISHYDLHKNNVLIEPNEDPALEGVNFRLTIIDFDEADECSRSNQDIISVGELISPKELNYHSSSIDNLNTLPRSVEKILQRFSLEMQTLSGSDLSLNYWYSRLNMLLETFD